MSSILPLSRFCDRMRWNEAVEVDKPSPLWPASLDALVAAPRQHQLLLEDERVRVLDTRIEPGDVTPIHTHRWPAAHYVLSWSAFVRRDAGGNVLVDTRVTSGEVCPATALWGEPLAPHSLENVGPLPLHVISVEIKQ